MVEEEEEEGRRALSLPVVGELCKAAESLPELRGVDLDPNWIDEDFTGVWAKS